MKGFLLPIFLVLLISQSVMCQISQESIDKMTIEVNKVRASGVKCGSTRMPPVHELYWNEKLYTVSEEYASYMEEHDHFDHISIEGEDAGMRLDKAEYKWRYVGENIAFGQFDFYEVLKDWVKSESHCKMLMSPNVRHFAVAREKEYWVQTFATPMR